MLAGQPVENFAYLPTGDISKISHFVVYHFHISQCGVLKFSLKFSSTYNLVSYVNDDCVSYYGVIGPVLTELIHDNVGMSTI